MLIFLHKKFITAIDKFKARTSESEFSLRCAIDSHCVSCKDYPIEIVCSKSICQSILASSCFGHRHIERCAFHCNSLDRHGSHLQCVKIEIDHICTGRESDWVYCIALGNGSCSSTIDSTCI